ncbi:IS30 family transposase [Clostridium thermosuccinogenes]|uniref:IS30 family transposase n=1 Tax=Clostridium thermosuccinogenes TaxID=84032 RepID=UPI000CCC1C1C|nr:IS30 family transposase [Pseudoclostridium thermosuccinogenes]PNT91623.1 helix-turn-helix domain containing protein [Pseudoclostridium thermosuccinogenes]PNT92508.1 helix-turn-helix domain containing protein [Pseudoclostridium thermosuccinogenes]PNT92516.1 helix-turn-helix domain containing protein [Pseudoclostridium thermosuccinogenes]PNT92523.1 helix-turn-helix domain containing protein [Pseudoclostridium thermosuccinogenes]
MRGFKHLSQEERNIIEQRLISRKSFKSIARELGKDPTTISKEVKNHIQFRKTGCYGRVFNDCKHRIGCPVKHLCGSLRCSRYCRACKSRMCSSLCHEYQQEICPKLSKPPYVCNGCEDKQSCTLEKRIYSATHAQREYETVRSECRQGLQITEEEAIRLDSIISPLLIKGQSLHHICINHADEIMLDERTLYNYVDKGIFTAKNIDMPRVVRMGRRKKGKDQFKVDKKCRIGRTYQDFLKFMQEHPDLPVVEMDTVIGRIGGKVLLTLHFTVPQLMLAFIRDANTSQSVIDIFDQLYLELGPDTFRKLFPVLLCDNGSEFSNPSAIEFDSHGQRRTWVFYCNPLAPYQKGAAENNHALIRRIIPKGTSLDEFTQRDITLMMNHINSYSRLNLGDKTPYWAFGLLYGEEILRRMNVELIPTDNVTLHSSLLKK